MKFNKFILIFSIVFILLSISAVSANDISSNETVGLAEDNNPIGINENSIYVDDIWGNDLNDGKTQDTSVKSLKTALELSSDNATIYVSSGNYTSDRNTGITIEKSVSIIGSKDTAFDGLNKDYLFIINDGITVSFKNIKFVNAYKAPAYDESVYGSALEIKDAKVTIDNCTFINNNVNRNSRNSVYGGAISNFGDLTILNSYFNNNSVAVTSIQGGGLNSQGGSIFNKGNLTIRNSSILNSKSGTYSSGGAIANHATLKIYDSIISNSSSDSASKGSAVYNAGDFYLSNSVIENSTIQKTGFMYLYGAVYNEGTFTAIGNIFQNNKVIIDSASVEFRGSGNIYNSGELNLTYNAFINNQNANNIARDVFDGGKIISLDNNWWGTNDNPYTDGNRINQEGEVTSWLTFTLTPEYTPLNISDSALIKAVLQSNSGVCDISLFPVLNTTFKTFDISRTEVLENGEADFIFNYTQNKGLYEVTADFNGFSQTVEVDVGKLISDLTYNLTDNIQYLDTLKINVSVTGSGLKTPTGVVLVRIMNGTKLVTAKSIDLINGEGTLEISNLNPGKYNVKLIYDGDGDYFKAFESTDLTIRKQPVNLSLTIPSIKIDEKATYAYVCLDTKGAQGMAVLYLNGKEYRKPYLYNGNTTIQIKNLAEGEYNATLAFLGSDQYEAANASTTFKVSKYSTLLNIYAHDINVGELEALIVESLPEDLEGYAVLRINNVEEDVYIEGQANTTIEISDLGPGLYTVEIIYLGDSKYYGANDTASFRVIRPNSTLDVNITKDDHNLNGTITVTVDPLNCTGLVGVYVNYKFYSLNLTDGKAFFDVEFDRGTNYIFVYYEGNDYFEGSTWNTTLGVADNFVFIGENATAFEHNDFNYSVRLIEVTGIPMPSRNVIVKLGDDSWNITTDEDGFAYLPLNLNKGVYTIFATYENQTINNTLTINAIKYDIHVNNINCGEVEAIEVTCDENLTGRFNLNIANVMDVNLDIVNGSVAYNLSGLKGGKYTLKVKYVNDKYASSQISKQFTVKKLNLDLKVDFNQNEFTITAYDFENATGNVSFTVDGVEYNVPINNSQAVLAKRLDEGNHTLKVNYKGDDFYNSCTLNTHVDVKMFATSILLSIKDAYYGESLTAVANVDKNATGTVRFTVADLTKDISVSKGVAKWTFTGLNAGNYTITAVYLGNPFYSESRNETSFSVLKHDSSIDLSIKDSVYGKTLTAVANVDKDATGTVRFTMDNLTKDVSIDSGVAKWTFGGVDAGSHEITATYMGDDYYCESQITTPFKISKAKSKIIVYVNEAVLYENIRIYANLSTNATGSVLFSMKDYYSPRYKNVYNSQSMWYISPLDTGLYEVSASYTGDKNYYPSNTTYILNIYQKKAILEVTIEDVRVVDRAVAKINLKNASGDPIEGVVNVQLNGKSYDVEVNGETNLVIGRLPANNYTFTARFDGNDEYAKASVKGEFEVIDSLINVVIVANNLTKFYKGPQDYVILLKTNKGKVIPDANVYLTVNGKTYTLVTDSNGKTSLPINLRSGNYTILLTTDEDDVYHNASKTALITVLPTVEGIDLAKVYGSNTQYFAIFSDSNGKVLANTKVTFTIGSNSYSAKTLPNGVCRLNINLNPGTYSITAINPVTGEKATNKIFVYNYLMENKDLTKYFRGPQGYKVRAYGDDGKVAVGVTVKITVNGKTYSVITDEEGYASLDINLNPGTYTIKSTYNGYSVSNKITVKTTIVTSNLSKKKSKTASFQAKLLDTNGKILKGKTITFKFNGKTYSAKTNSKGIASLSIKSNLKVGTYKIYTTYGKLTRTNTITVKK